MRELVATQQTLLRQSLENLKNEKKNSVNLVKAAKAKFASEKSEDANSKRFGQPVRAAIEQIMKKHGIDRAAFHGGDLQGPACRTLLIKRRAIFSDVWHHIECLPAGEKLGNDVMFKEVLDAYERLLGHFDAIFAISKTKRHHMKEEQLNSLEKHVKHACAVWRGLGISITPKMHIIEDHLEDSVQKTMGSATLVRTKANGHIKPDRRTSTDTSP